MDGTWMIWTFAGCCIVSYLYACLDSFLKQDGLSPGDLLIAVVWVLGMEMWYGLGKFFNSMVWRVMFFFGLVIFGMGCVLGIFLLCRRAASFFFDSFLWFWASLGTFIVLGLMLLVLDQMMRRSEKNSAKMYLPT